MSHDVGPIAQIRYAARSPGALIMGGVLGAFMPLASAYAVHDGRLIVHEHSGGLNFAHWSNPEWLLVLGGLAFSAKTVTQWASVAYGDWVKSLGFVVMIEGSLLMHPTPWLRVTALTLLCAINAIATGCLLALRDQSDRIVAVPVEPLDPSELPTSVRFRPELPAETATRLEPSSTRPELALKPSVARLEGTDGASGDQLTDAELYSRALAYLETVSACSMSSLRTACNIGRDRATELLSRLESDGVVGPVGRGNRHPVLLAATAAE